MYEASATVLLTFLETTVAIERSLRAERNASPAMPPAWEASLAVAMPEKKGWGAAQATPNPQPAASGFPPGPGRCLVSLQVGLVPHLLLSVPLLPQGKGCFGQAPEPFHMHTPRSRRACSLAGLSPYFLGSRSNFVSFDPLLLPLFGEPDRPLATLIWGTDFF